MAQEGQHEVTNSSSKLTNTLLNGKNYLTWAKAAARALSGREMREYITGENKEPEIVNPLSLTEAEKKSMKKWRTQNDKIITWLTNSMEPAIAELFLLPDTAFELWQAVKEMYGQENNYSRIYQLKFEINQERQGSRKHVQYLNALQKKKDELRLYRPATTDLAVIKKREEEYDIFEYLAGLNPSYEAVRAQIMNTVPLPSYSQIKNMIQQEEGRREAMGCSQPTPEEMHEPHGFPAVRSSNFSKKVQNPRSRNYSNNSNELKRCTGCRKEGHTYESCWFLHPHLKPKHWKNGGEKGDRLGGRERRREEASVEAHRVFSEQPLQSPYSSVNAHNLDSSVKGPVGATAHSFYSGAPMHQLDPIANGSGAKASATSGSGESLMGLELYLINYKH